VRHPYTYRVLREISTDKVPDFPEIGEIEEMEQGLTLDALRGQPYVSLRQPGSAMVITSGGREYKVPYGSQALLAIKSLVARKRGITLRELRLKPPTERELATVLEHKMIRFDVQRNVYGVYTDSFRWMKQTMLRACFFNNQVVKEQVNIGAVITQGLTYYGQPWEAVQLRSDDSQITCATLLVVFGANTGYCATDITSESMVKQCLNVLPWFRGRDLDDDLGRLKSALESGEKYVHWDKVPDLKQGIDAMVLRELGRIRTREILLGRSNGLPIERSKGEELLRKEIYDHSVREWDRRSKERTLLQGQARITREAGDEVLRRKLEEYGVQDLIDLVLGRWRREDETLFGLLQALTGVYSHDVPPRGSSDDDTEKLNAFQRKVLEKIFVDLVNSLIEDKNA
jgi:hypothetical protein